MGVSTSGIAGSVGIFFDRGNPTITANAGTGTFTVKFDPGATLGKVDAGVGTFNVALDPGHTLGALSGINTTINVILDPGHELGTIKGTNSSLAVFLDPGHLIGSVTANAGSGSFTVQFDPGHELGVIRGNTNTLTVFIPDTGHTLGNVSVTNTPTVTANAGTGSFTVQLDPGHTLGAITNTGFNVNNSPTVTANAGTGSFTVQLDPGHTLGAITNTGFNVNNSPTVTANAGTGTLTVAFDPGHELGSIRGNTNTLTVFIPDTGHTLGNVSVTNTPTVTANAGTGTFQIFLPDTGHELGAIRGNTNTLTIFIPDTSHTLGKVDAGVGTFNIQLDPGHTLGMLVANQSINVNQVSAAAVSTAASGVQKVGVVGNAGAIFDGATGSAVPANAIYGGARAATANPTNATGGNTVGIMADKAGRIVITGGQVRELIGIQQTAVAAITESTIITAGAAGVFNDLVALIITTAGAAAQTITIKDATAGTKRFVINYPNAALAPGTPFILCLGFAIPQAVAANNWTVTQSAATACNYTAIFLKNT